jgi:Na+/H+ antiporter NhaC
MANLIEFFRMVLSYLFTFAVIAIVSGIGGFVGVKVWKPKQKTDKTAE